MIRGEWGCLPIPVVPRFKVWDQVYDLTLSNKYEIAKGFLKVYYDDGHIRWKNQWDTGTKVAFDPTRIGTTMEFVPRRG